MLMVIVSAIPTHWILFYWSSFPECIEWIGILICLKIIAVVLKHLSNPLIFFWPLDHWNVILLEIILNSNSFFIWFLFLLAFLFCYCLVFCFNNLCAFCNLLQYGHNILYKALNCNTQFCISLLNKLLIIIKSCIQVTFILVWPQAFSTQSSIGFNSLESIKSGEGGRKSTHNLSHKNVALLNF